MDKTLYLRVPQNSAFNYGNRMKKLILFCSIILLSWNCSTKLDILDNYKETAIVYCLLDQTQPVQYIRIEKAFLGADNALTMAQNYDTITYGSELSVKVEELLNGQVTRVFTTQPVSNNDTISTLSFIKDPGAFAGPCLIYAFNTPGNSPLRSNCQYKLTVYDTRTNNTVTATTSLIETSTNNVFNIVSPATTVSMEPIGTQTEFDFKWNAAPSARIYQPTLKFYYTEYYVNGDSAQKVTNEWNLAVQTTDDLSASTQIDIKTDKLSFYHFLQGQIAVDNNVVKRRAKYLEFVVYAANDVLKNYIEINGASSSLSQDHPLYTNIVGGYGVFAARSKAVKSGVTLTAFSINGDPPNNNFLGLATGPYTCQFNFLRSTDPITALPPGCP
jgi:hypothetical protein